jgi:hypothetical protein
MTASVKAIPELLHRAQSIVYFVQISSLQRFFVRSIFRLSDGSFKLASDFHKIRCGYRISCQVFFQFAARIVIAVSAGFNFLRYGAWPYRAEFSAKTRNHIRLTSVAVNVFWPELDIALIRPVSGYVLFPFKVFRLSCFECFALVAVQSTIGNHLRHHLTLLFLTCIVE